MIGGATTTTQLALIISGFAATTPSFSFAAVTTASHQISTQQLDELDGNNHKHNNSTTRTRSLGTDTNSNARYITTCYNVPEWTDSEGDSCQWYAQEDYCEAFGVLESTLNMGHTASTACCACGGGYTDDMPVPSFSPTATPQPSDEVDIAVSNCGGEDGNAADCPTSAPTTSCVDIVPWSNSLGRGCEYYDTDTFRCDTDGNDYFHEGHVALTACCACGGGVLYASALVREQDGVYANQHDDSDVCVNLADWQVRVGSSRNDDYNNKADANGILPAVLTCDDYSKTKTGLSCGRYGHLSDEGHNVHANRACCICGGGHRGSLIGRRLRAAFPGDAELKTPLYTTNNGAGKNGSVVEFMNMVVSSAGCGLYEQDISNGSLQVWNGNTHRACLRDLSLGLVDVCIGPFSSASVDTVLFSDTLYVEQYYLAVPLYHVGYWESLATPFLPFTGLAWLAVLAAIFFTVLAMNFIASDGEITRLRDMSIHHCFRRCSHVVYSGLRSFATLDVANAPDEPSKAEQVIIAGFVVFALVVVTAYTATSATALYVAYDYKPYESLNDVIMSPENILCVQLGISSEFSSTYPEASYNIVTMDVTNKELLEAIEDGTCDVAVVTKDSFEAAAKENSAYCSSLEVLGDEILLEKLNAIPISFMAGKYGEELAAMTSEMINLGYYESLHAYYAMMDDNVSSEERLLENESIMSEMEEKQNDESHLLVYGTRSLKTSSGGGSGGKPPPPPPSSSSTETSSQTFTVCTKSKLEDDGLYSLEPHHLSMPLSITVFCSSLGVCIFLITKYRKKRKLAQLKKEQELYEKNGSKELLSRASIKHLADEEFLITSEIQGMEPVEMWDELILMGVDGHLITSALNKLPDTTGLHNLLMTEKMSSLSKELRLIQGLSIADLSNVLLAVRNDQEGMNDVTLARGILKSSNSWRKYLNTKDPKGKLAEEVMRDPTARYVARTRALFLQRQQPEDPIRPERKSIDTFSEFSHESSSGINRRFGRSQTMDYLNSMTGNRM